MKEDLLKIITYYKINNQQRKLMEEIFELQEAVTMHELKSSVEYEIPLTEIVGTKEHIEEEFADVMVLLEQFKVYYNLDNDKIVDIMYKKINRQLERIKNENN